MHYASATIPELLQMLHNRNAGYIKWLEVIVRADCKHVDHLNVVAAEELIEVLAKQNRAIMEDLTELAKANLIPIEEGKTDE